MAIQTAKSLLLFGRYGELNAMRFPTSRGSTKDITMILHPTGTTKS